MTQRNNNFNAARQGWKIMLTAAAVGMMLALTGCTGRDVPVDELLNRAVDCGRSGNWQSCEENALAVLKKDPLNTHALLLRSLAAEHLGKNDVALSSARQAAENAPGDFAVQYSYGRLLALKPGRAKEAIQVLERALKLRPGNRNTLILLGQCGSQINSDKTIEYYMALPETVRRQPEIQTRIAIYYLDRRDQHKRNLDLALRALANAYNTAPDNPVIVLNLALFLDHQGFSKRKAVAFYERYLNLTRQNPELNSTRAQVKSRISVLRGR
ncbi:MAG: tetratricopeptide repeat protein [Lentisphaerae bacterium]|nr:tetratricopeptide repeat protein [Lentisphaerota bacterium]